MIFHADTFTRKKATHGGMDMEAVHSYYATLGEHHDPAPEISHQPESLEPIEENETATVLDGNEDI